MIDLQFIPHRNALLADQDNTLDVLLLARAQAASPTQRERMPLNLAIVIDRSGSMSGRPLAEAKRCAGMIIDGLSERDLASVVVYDHVANVLVGARPVHDKQFFRSALATVESGGYTDLHAGWLTGAEQAARKQDGKALSRVLLLSDGCANQGITDSPSIAKHCAEMADAGVSTSSYGLGEDFNEQLMTEMARAGQGNAYYGQTAQDLMDPFRTEFDLMSALCARGLRLALAPAAGLRVEVVNGYRADADGRFLLPDLAYGSEAWALLRLTVPRSALETAGHGDVHLLTASLSYTDLDGQPGQAEPIHLRLPCLPAPAFAAVAASELVTRRALELRTATLEEQSREAAQVGDWNRVQQLLAELRALAEGHPWLRASVEKLEGYARRQERERFSKEARYTSSIKRQRLTSPGERADWSEAEERDTPSWLRRKLEQGKRFEDPDKGDPSSGSSN
jgi:Ca-activated chloride channel family protein